MKNRIGFYFIFFIVVFGFSFITQKSNCDDAFFNREGYSITITMFDSTGKADGRRVTTVLSSEMKGDTLVTQLSSVSGHSEDEKETKRLVYRCINNSYSMDGSCAIAAMNTKMPLEYIRFTELKLDMPQYFLDMKLNDTLPDSDTRIAFKMRQSYGMKTSGTRVVAIYTKRKCIGLDTLEIDGQSCRAHVIESDLTSLVSGMGETMNSSGHVKEWFSPQYGLIRTEYYVNGRLSRTEVATAIKLPQ